MCDEKWWWGGQFERMVSSVKNKTIRCGFVSWAELKEVLLYVEITLNDSPLSYSTWRIMWHFQSSPLIP